MHSSICRRRLGAHAPDRRGIVALRNCGLRDAGLPGSGTQATLRLAPLDKARLEETLHLKQALGETMWPGVFRSVLCQHRLHPTDIGDIIVPSVSTRRTEMGGNI
jgi:hypothetical protein